MWGGLAFGQRDGLNDPWKTHILLLLNQLVTVVHKSISQFSNQLALLRSVIDVHIFCAKPNAPRTTALSEAGARLLPTKQATTRVYLLCTLFSVKWRRSKVAGLAHKDEISQWWWSWQRITQNSEAQPLLSSTGVPLSAPSCAHKWRGF